MLFLEILFLAHLSHWLKINHFDRWMCACIISFQQLFQRSFNYSKTCVKRQLSKRHKIGFQEQLSLNAVQKYCRMGTPHSAILLDCIKVPFVIEIFVLSIFELLFYTGFTVLSTGWNMIKFGRNDSYMALYTGFQVGPTFPIFPTFPYFFDLLRLFPTFS